MDDPSSTSEVSFDRTPSAPPPIPWTRRVLRLGARVYPFLVWCGAIAWAVHLHAAESGFATTLGSMDLRLVHVALPVEGKIAELRVEIGQRVQSGEVVATLDTGIIDTELSRAKARLTRAHAQIAAESERIRGDRDKQRKDFAERQADFETNGRRQRAVIEQLVAKLATDRAEALNLAPEIDRLRQAHEQKLVTADRLDELVRQHAVLLEAIEVGGEQLRLAREDLLASARFAPEHPMELDDEALLRPVRSEVETAEAELLKLELRRRAQNLLAPDSGVVSRITARPGEWCALGSKIIEIVVPESSRLTAYLTGPQVSTVRVGDSAGLRSRTRNGPPMKGRVAIVGPRVEMVPVELRANASLVEWGQMIVIEVQDSTNAIPGEVFNVSLR